MSNKEQQDDHLLWMLDAQQRRLKLRRPTATSSTTTPLHRTRAQMQQQEMEEMDQRRLARRLLQRFIKDEPPNSKTTAPPAFCVLPSASCSPLRRAVKDVVGGPVAVHKLALQRHQLGSEQLIRRLSRVTGHPSRTAVNNNMTVLTPRQVKKKSTHVGNNPQQRTDPETTIPRQPTTPPKSVGEELEQLRARMRYLTNWQKHSAKHEIHNNCSSDAMIIATMPQQQPTAELIVAGRIWDETCGRRFERLLSFSLHGQCTKDHTTTIHRLLCNPSGVVAHQQQDATVEEEVVALPSSTQDMIPATTLSSNVPREKEVSTQPPNLKKDKDVSDDSSRKNFSIKNHI